MEQYLNPVQVSILNLQNAKTIEAVSYENLIKYGSIEIIKYKINFRRKSEATRESKVLSKELPCIGAS